MDDGTGRDGRTLADFNDGADNGTDGRIEDDADDDDDDGARRDRAGTTWDDVSGRPK
jgi:hypothetical protein